MRIGPTLSLLLVQHRSPLSLQTNQPTNGTNDMATAVNATSSTVELASVGVPTRQMNQDEWFFEQSRDFTTSTMDTTTAVTRSARETERGACTDQIEPRNVSRPFRKESFSIRLPQTRVKLLQQWECVITSVHEDCVECEMYDLRGAGQPVEYAEVYIDEFSHFDKPLLQEGAVFYWSIGHSTSKSGQVRRYSELRVRRMPPLSNSRKKEIAQEAEQLHELFNTSAK